MPAAKQPISTRTRNVIDRLLAVAPDATVITDTDGRMVRVNANAEELLGYSQRQLLGQKPDLLMSIPSRERKVKLRGGQVARPKIWFGDSVPPP
jgi:PAS domain S-box-containing protein